MGFGLIKALIPRAAFRNVDKLLTGIVTPAERAPLINADVYYHECTFPVSSARLLGTFKIDEPIYFKLALAQDTDVAIRTIGRGSRGLKTTTDVAEAEPDIYKVKGIGGGLGALKENDGYSYARSLPAEPTINFLQSFKLTDDPTHQEIDLTTYGVPTGMLNAKTDFFASGVIAVTTGTIAASSLSTLVCAARLDLQPNQGIYIAGAGPSGAALVTTIVSASDDGKTFELAAAAAAAVTTPALVQADDTAAIQNWINAKGDLWLPPGYYRLTAPIVVPTTSEGFSVIIHGSGWDLSTFAFQHHGDGFVPTPPDLKIDSFTLMDLTVATGTIGDTSGTIDAMSQGIGIRFVAPATGGVYNNNVMQRCRVIGWGRWGIWSDNLQVCWFNNVIFRSNRCGHVAFVAPDTRETYKLPNANALVNCTFENAQGGMTSLRSVSASMSAGSRTLSGSGFTAADRGCLVVVPGAGVGSPAADLFTFIDVVNSSSSVTLAHQATTSMSGTAQVFPLAVASVLLVRAHDTLISGATFQGNFDSSISSTTTDTNTIKVYASDNLHLESIHEEDTGGFGGAAVRLEGCRATLIENWGGTSAEAGAVNAHNCDFELHDCHAVAVRGSFFNDRPQFNIDSTSSEVTLDDSLIVGWINLWQQDRSWDKLRVGSGVRSYQAATALTSQSCGNEYIYDGLFGRDLLRNGRFIDSKYFSTDEAANAGWVTTNPSWWSHVFDAQTKGGAYIKLNATAIASAGAQKVFSQTVAIPDSHPAGQFTLAFDWFIESQTGAPDISGQYTEVRLHPSSGNDETMTWWTRTFTYVTGVWQTAQIKCWLDGSTSRTIEVQLNVTPGPNNVIIRFANFRLTVGKHSFGSWERAIHDFGGRVRAPIEYEPISTTNYPPPSSGSSVVTLINDAGVFKVGSNGSYVTLSTSASGAGHQIAEEGTVLTQRTILNFVGQGITAADDAAATPVAVTKITLNAATLTTEGIVSTVAQDIGGRKTFWNGLQSIDAVGVPVVAQYSGSTVGAHIQEWWIGGATPIAYLDAQPTLRLGIPASRAGAIELCSDVGSPTQTIVAGVNPAAVMVFFLPRFLPSAGQVLVSTTAGGPNITLGWANLPSGSGGYATIQDEGVNVTPARVTLDFRGGGVIAADDGVAATRVTVLTASASQEGCVSTSAQSFAGRKTFQNGLQSIDSTGVPIVAQYSGGISNSHIQEWWIGGSNPIAWIDTQPTLRIGARSGEGSRDGYIELANASTTATVKLTAYNATASQTIVFPAAAATAAGQSLQVQSVGSGVVVTQWAAAVAYSQIQKDSTNVSPQRSVMSFNGPAWNVSDNSAAAPPYTQIMLNYATQTAEGIVSAAAQNFGGLKTFFNSATILGTGSTQAFLVVQGASSGVVAGAKAQEWKDQGGVFSLAFIDVNAKFRIGNPGSGYTGTIEFCSVSSANTTSLQCAASPAASLIYVLPSGSPTANQVLQASAPAGGVVTLSWASSAGTIGGSGASPRIAMFSAATTLASSGLQDNGSQILTDRPIWPTSNGTANLGDLAPNLFGGVYVLNGVFCYPSNNTRSTSKTIGFVPANPTGPAAATDEMGQFLVYGIRNVLSSGDQLRTALSSYYGIEIRGTRLATAALGPVSGTSTDPSVSIFAEQNVTAVRINSNNITGGNFLLDVQNSSVRKFSIDGTGATVALGQVSAPNFSASASGNAIVATTGSIAATGASGSFIVGSNSGNPGAAGALLQNNYLALCASTVNMAMYATLSGSTPVIAVKVGTTTLGSEKYVPFGNGINANDTFLWDTSVAPGKWVVGAIPGGTGSGANIQLSNLDASGTAPSGNPALDPAVRINAHLGFSVDGGWNIGAPSHRVGNMYLLGTFFMYPAGSTNSASPRAFGFLNPASNEYTRVLLSGNQSVVEGGGSSRTTVTAQYGIELRGSRNSGTAPGATAGSTSDPCVSVIADRNMGTVLKVDSATTIAAANNLADFSNAGVQKLVLRGDGSLVELGAHQFAGRVVNTTYTLTTTDCLLICDVSGGTNYVVTLPSAFTNGIIFYIVREPYAPSGGGNVTVTPQSGDVFNGVLNGSFTLTTALQKLMVIAWQQRWYSFSV